MNDPLIERLRELSKYGRMVTCDGLNIVVLYRDTLEGNAIARELAGELSVQSGGVSAIAESPLPTILARLEAAEKMEEGIGILVRACEHGCYVGSQSPAVTAARNTLTAYRAAKETP